MKKRLDIRIAEDLRDGIDLVASRDGHSLTAIVERYVRDGLARDNGQLVEQSTLPLIRPNSVILTKGYLDFAHFPEAQQEFIFVEHVLIRLAQRSEYAA